MPKLNDARTHTLFDVLAITSFEDDVVNAVAG